MANALVIRLRTGKSKVDLPATLLASGAGAAARFDETRGHSGIRLLVGGEPAYLAQLVDPAPAGAQALVEGAKGRLVEVVFAGRSALRRKLYAVDVKVVAAAPAAAAVDLTSGRAGAAPLFLLADGSFSQTAAGAGPRGMDALPALVTAARWITTRRTSTFERLFPPDPFRPELAPRTDRLTVGQGKGLLDQLDSALAAAAVGGDAARRDPESSAQLRSAALTALSHLAATVLADTSFRALADAAIARIFALIEGREGRRLAPGAARARHPAAAAARPRAPGRRSHARHRAPRHAAAQGAALQRRRLDLLQRPVAVRHVQRLRVPRGRVRSADEDAQVQGGARARGYAQGARLQRRLSLLRGAVQEPVGRGHPDGWPGPPRSRTRTMKWATRGSTGC